MGFDENIYHIAVVDDNEDFLIDVKQFLKEYFEDQKQSAMIDVFEKPTKLLWNLNDGKKYDLYILDYKMPQMDGIMLARNIRIMDEWSRILMLTDYTDGLLKGYEVRLYRYIMKLNYKDEIIRVLPDCYQAWQKQKTDYYLFHYDDKLRIVPHRDIQYIQYDSVKRMLTITTEKEKLQERKPLVKILEEINQDFLLIICKGVAVNLMHVVSAEKETVILKSGVSLHLGRTSKKEFLFRMTQWYK